MFTMLVERYTRVCIVSSRNTRKINQFVLSLIEFKVVFFCLIDDFVSRFLQNFAVSFRKFVIRQNVNVIDKVDKV